MHQSGLIIHSIRRASGSSNPCSIDQSNKMNHDNRPLKMSMIDLSAAFVLLGSGLSISIVVFIGEKIIFKIRKKIHYKQPSPSVFIVAPSVSNLRT